MDTSVCEFGNVIVAKVFQSKIKNRMANSVAPDEMAHYEHSHLALHCLHRYLF